MFEKKNEYQGYVITVLALMREFLSSKDKFNSRFRLVVMYMYHAGTCTLMKKSVRDNHFFAGATSQQVRHVHTQRYNNTDCRTYSSGMHDPI